MKWKWFIVGILLYIGILYPISFFTFSSLFPILWVIIACKISW
jgi:hypothetical protein